MTIFHQNLIEYFHRAAIITYLSKVIEQAPWFVPKMKSGASFKYRMTNAGKYGWISDEKGYRYVERNPHTGLLWPSIPASIIGIVRQLSEMQVIPANFRPESMLINQYLTGESLGLHQDRSEKNLDAPIISISLGSPGIFLLGGSKRNDAIEEIVLDPGDVFVMSGVCRMKFHGFKGITKGNKRVNLTIRQAY